MGLLLCVNMPKSDGVCSLDKGLSLAILTLTAFSVLVYRTVFLAGSWLQPQRYPVAD